MQAQIKAKAIALAVDDEPDILELIKMTLERMDIIVHTATNIEAAKKQLACNAYDLCLTDMRLPDGDGLKIIQELKETSSNPEIIIMTGQGDPDGVEIAIKNGAWCYLEKSSIA